MNANVINSSTTQEASKVGFNISLLKGGTITQTILGAVISAGVVAAVVATVVLVIVVGGKQPPVVANDFGITYKRIPIKLDVLANDFDPAKNNLTLVSISQPTHGIAWIDKGLVYYQSSGGFWGYDNFTYIVSNQYLNSNGTVQIKVLNYVPEAIPITYTLGKNSKTKFLDIFNYVDDMGVKISDLDNDPLQVVSVSDKSKIIISTGNSSDSNDEGLNEKYSGDKKVIANGIYYTPQYNFNGIEYFNYTITDGADTSTSYIKIVIENNPPTAVDDVFMVPKYSAMVLNVTANDYDVNNDPYFISSFSGVGIGAAKITDDGKTITYYTSGYKDKAYFDSFEYSIQDTAGAIGQAVVFIQVYNSPPVLSDQIIYVNKSSINNNIEVNPSDPDLKDTVTLTSIYPHPSTLPPVANGTNMLDMRTRTENVYLACCDWLVMKRNVYYIVFTPVPGQVYTQTYNLIVSDGEAETKAKYQIIIRNNPPIAVTDYANCSKNKKIYVNVLANDYDTNPTDQPKLKLTSGWTFKTSLNGTITPVNDTHVLYTAPNGLLGQDTAQYEITDQTTNEFGKLDATSFARGYLIVTLVNDPPQPMDDNFQIPKGKTTLLNVLLNDIDPNDGEGSISKINSISLSTRKNIQSIIATGSNGKDWASYKATNDFYSDSFQYDILDMDGMVSLKKAVVTITTVNSAPIANNDQFTISWNSTNEVLDVKKNDVDENGDDLIKATITIVSNPTKGTAQVINNGFQISYTPNPGFVGVDELSYNLNDGFPNGISNTAKVTINVNNAAPIAMNDYASIHWSDTSGVIMYVLSNDTDADGDPLAILSVSVNSQIGTASIDDTYSKLIFVPNPSSPSIGKQTFTYTITDWNKQATGTVFIDITNTKPIANDDTFSVHWSAKQVSLNVLRNDLDNDGDIMTVGSIDNTNTKGVISISSNKKSVLYSAPTSTMAGDSFRYTTFDGAENSLKAANVAIIFTNNDKPVASNSTYQVHWRQLSKDGGNKDFTISSINDSEGDSITVTTQFVSGSGSCLVVTSGSTRFVRVAVTNQYIGTTICKFVISDGKDSAEAFVSVITTNQAPSCKSMSISFDPALYNTGASFPITNYVTDNDNLDIPFLVPTSAQAGSGSDVFNVQGNQLFFKPGSLGSKTYTWKVTDGLATSSNCQFTVYVSSSSNTNFNQRYSVHWNSTNNLFDVLQYFAAGSVIKSISTTQTTGAVAIVNNKISYTPIRKTGYDVFDLTFFDGVANNNINVAVTIYNSIPTFSVPLQTTGWNNPSGILINLVSGASDADIPKYETGLTISSIDSLNTAKGTVTLISSTTAKFIPTGDLGYGTFNAYGTDGLDTVRFTVTVLITNDAPITNPKNFTIHWKQHAAGQNLQVLTSGGIADSDPNSDPLIISRLISASPVGSSTVLLQDSKSVTVKSTSIYLGTFSFGYYASDTKSETLSSVSVKVYNNLVSPKTTSRTIHWRDTNVVLDPIVSFAPNYLDVDGDTLTVSSVYSQRGSAVIDSSKRIIYKPPTSQPLGSDLVTYRIYDGAQTSGDAYVNIGITNTNPIGISGTVTTTWSSPIAIDMSTSCSDNDANDKQFVSFNGVTSNVVGGSLTVNGKIVTFTPSTNLQWTLNTDYYQSIGSFNFQCFDGIGYGTGNIKVTIQNHPPTGNGAILTIPRDYSKTFYDIPYTSIATNVQDIDGDTVSYQNIAALQLTTGVSISTTNTGVRFQTPRNVEGVQTVTFKLFDGVQYSDTKTLQVTFTNQAPTCQSISLNIPKATTYGLSKDISSKSGDPNNDVLTYTVSTSTINTAVGQLQGLTYYSANKNSGKQTTTYTATDVSGLNAQCQLVITTDNTAPVATDATYSISLNQPVSDFYFNYIGDGKATDADLYDSLTLIITDKGTCQDFSTVLEVSNNKIHFTRLSTFIKGSCSLKVQVKDDDQTNPKTSNIATVNIMVSSQEPVARNDRFQIDQGQTIRIYVDQILANDNDEFGGTDLTFVKFDCPDATYCHRTPRLLNINGKLAIEVDSDKTTCQADRFTYTMQTNTLKQQRSATVFIEFKNCYCSAKLDFMFVLDASGSIGTTNYNLMRNLGKSIIGRMNVGADSIRVGIVRFHDDATLALPLSTDPKLINNTFTTMPYEAGWTAQLPGIKAAMNEFARNGRTDADKVMFILTDGLANRPCSCSGCASFWGSTPSLYPDTVERQIIKNNQLNNQQKYNAYLDMCKYQMPYDPNDPNPQYYWKIDCSKCNWNYYYSSCLPCADAVPVATKINSWKRGSDGKVPNDPDNPFNGYNINWKIIAMGVGDGLQNDIGARELRGMNYDADRTMNVPWDDLAKTFSEIVDQSCNAVNTATQT